MAEQTTHIRRRRKAARPGEIVAAGMAEFAEKGFAAARLDDIARRAGVVKGTLYLYFDSKEALFKEAVRAQVLPSIAGLESLAAGFEGPTEALIEAVIRELYAEMVEGDARAILRILVAEGARFPEIIDFYYEEVVSVAERILLSLLERGVARGEFRGGPILDAQLVVIGPAIAAAIWRLTFEHARPLDLDAYCKAHLDVMLAGLRKTPA
ncbi:TetR/AcrR family transcriptional regulator [Oceanibium sediminis]|uniref:TetR/AcrR family transcriptional regulator n=1 Tax=Oceanibium sediminis TaxID=2026339 RepID=UPI000DD3085F|nr:TetR/AcrR family transcriptional regulator [Oceanibium sediminis]